MERQGADGPDGSSATAPDEAGGTKGTGGGTDPPFAGGRHGPVSAPSIRATRSPKSRRSLRTSPTSRRTSPTSPRTWSSSPRIPAASVSNRGTSTANRPTPTPTTATITEPSVIPRLCYHVVRHRFVSGLRRHLRPVLPSWTRWQAEQHPAYRAYSPPPQGPSDQRDPTAQPRRTPGPCYRLGEGVRERGCHRETAEQPKEYVHER